MKVCIGTNNKHKYIDYQEAFLKYAPEVELCCPADLNITDDPEEDHETLLGNAIKKAQFFAEKSGLTTIADDTGLFVDALNGEPGLHTKRWHEGTDHDRCVKLLERLEDKDRSVEYKWGFAAYNPKEQKLWTFECEVKGNLLDKFGAEGGFGYDRVFKLITMDKYYSELTREELVQVGGRGMAMKELIFNSNFLK